MNFFAHAVLASRRSEDPSWLLGSMLPDFVSMAGLRLTGILGEPALERGVAFHHDSDDAFHGAPLFIELMEDAREALEREGLASGPAMAIGHVGVELLLDGILVTRQGVAPSFRAAVQAAGDLAPRLRFAGLAPELGEARWRQLCARLDGAPLPERYAEPAFVADRLIFILARRPRLAVPAADHGLVFEWAARALPLVSASADALFEQVEARLRDRPRPVSVRV
jgi:acyl carrier protein phosphodiesterase